MLVDVIEKKRFGDVLSYSYFIEFWTIDPAICYLYVILKVFEKRGAYIKCKIFRMIARELLMDILVRLCVMTMERG